MNRIHSILLLLTIAFAGCGESSFEELETRGFEPLPVLGDLDLSKLQITQAPDYIEVWRSGQVVPQSPSRSYGERCRDASDKQACEANFEMTLGSENRFPSCGNAPCLLFLMVNEDDESIKIGTMDGLVDFFGTVDSYEEAALIVSALGYEWNGQSVEESSYRAIEGGFEFIVTRLASDCPTIEVSRYFLRVLADGTVSVQDTEVWSKDSGCA